MFNTTICCPSIEKTLLKCYNSCWHSLKSHKNEVHYLTWFCFHLQMSGYLIYNNTFTNCHVGSFIGGGRRNQVFNNSYHNCSTAVHEDNRGMSWQKAFCSPVSSYKFTTAVWLHLLLVPFKHRTEIVNNSGALHGHYYIYYKMSMCGRWQKELLHFREECFSSSWNLLTTRTHPGLWSILSSCTSSRTTPAYQCTMWWLITPTVEEHLSTSVLSKPRNGWTQWPTILWIADSRLHIASLLQLELYNSWDKRCVVFMRLCVHFNHQAVSEPWH